jgi:serine/alanine adding enzyme
MLPHQPLDYICSLNSNRLYQKKVTDQIFKHNGLTIKTQVDETVISEWNRFLDAHPSGSVLQSWFSWQLFEQTEYFSPVFTGCFDEDGRMAGVLLGVMIREQSRIKGFFSSRVVVYGGPLIDAQVADKQAVFRMLLENLIARVNRKAIFIQIRASYDLSAYSEIFGKLGFNWVPRLNLLIDTTNETRVFAELSSSRRRQVRKSLSNGARIIEPVNLNQVREFYDILFDLYRHRVRKPLPDWSFFKAFFELIQESGNGKFFLIEYNKLIIGGIMSPYSPGKSLFEWYVCGLDTEFRALGIYPSVLATWAALEFAGKSGCKIFDFMGVGKPDELYGVRDFKMKFGGYQVNYGRYIRINNQLKYDVAEFGYNFLTWLKKV